MQEMLDLADPASAPPAAASALTASIYLTHATANYGGPVDPYTSERGAVWKVVPTGKVPAGLELFDPTDLTPLRRFLRLWRGFCSEEGHGLLLGAP
jgi:hypothetical protein